MEKMKAAIYMGDHKVEIKEVDIPELTDLTVKVKVAYAAMCATDYHCIYNGLFNRQSGWGVGHEVCGVIEESCGDIERYGYKVGDKVVINPLEACGKCYYCKTGRPQYCENKYDHRVTAFAEYSVVSVNQLHKLPDDADLRHACLVEPMSCAMRGIDLAKIKVGQNVAISGVGGIGSILLNMILLRGGANVTAIDPIPEKRENALAMGAQHVVDPANEDVVEKAMEITNGKGFDVVFEASGVPSAANPCIDMLASCGTIMYFAVYPTDFDLKLNLFNLYMKEGKIKTAYVSPVNYPRAISLLPRMQMDKIVGAEFTLDEFDKVLTAFKESKYPKIIVKC